MKFGTQMQFSVFSIEIWQKNINFFKFKLADGRHIENRFLAIVAIRPINAKIGTEMKKHMQI